MLYAAKMVRKAVESGNVEEARKQVLVAQQIFAKAAQKDIIKKNTASRRTSRLAKRVHALGSQK